MKWKQQRLGGCGVHAYVPQRQVPNLSVHGTSAVLHNIAVYAHIYFDHMPNPFHTVSMYRLW